MKLEDQRIAIAEWCGIDCSPMDICKCGDYAKHHIWEHGVVPMMDIGDIPDYLNDLNAMREAEEVLEIRGTGDKGHPSIPNDKFFEYLNKLQRLRFGGLTATAAQRAEALLKTIGKWQDSTLHTKG